MSPEKLTAGIMDRMAVAKTAATCVRVKLETSWPKPVVAETYNKVPSTSTQAEPLIGTAKTVFAISTSIAKLPIATAM